MSVNWISLSSVTVVRQKKTSECLGNFNSCADKSIMKMFVVEAMSWPCWVTFFNPVLFNVQRNVKRTLRSTKQWCLLSLWSVLFPNQIFTTWIQKLKPNRGWLQHSYLPSSSYLCCYYVGKTTGMPHYKTQAQCQQSGRTLLSKSQTHLVDLKLTAWATAGYISPLRSNAHSVL